MSSTNRRDLGHGVRVLPGESDGIVVVSEGADLGWRPRSGDRPGSAVTWEGSVFEVVTTEVMRRGFRWTLEPWSGEDVMRVVLPLDPNTVGAAAEAAGREARAAQLRPLAWLLLPILGLAIGPWQRKWRDDWGFPATAATWVSAILEAIAGAACVIELIAMIGGGGASVFPWLPRPLVLVGIFMMPEGLFRLAQVAADSEPVGSVFGLVVSVFERRTPPPPPPVPKPEVHAFDREEGVLELVSPIQRRDWEEPGVLPFRGKLFVMTSTGRLGESWLYGFEGVDEGEDRPGPRHRLLPARPRADAPPREASLGFFRVVLLTAATTLAPRRFQERWADQLNLRPVWLTIFGASAELLGGFTNLRAGASSGSILVILDLFFVVEAVIRFASVIVSGRPMGSLLGLPLTPILERFLPAADPRPDKPAGRRDRR
jgi:hypothetical protein